MKTNEVLEALENKLAKVQGSIERLSKTVANEELKDLTELTTALVKAKKDRDELQKQIDAEKSKAIVVDGGIETLEVLKHQFIPKGERLPKTIQDAAKLVIERAKQGLPKRVDLLKDYMFEKVFQ